MEGLRKLISGVFFILSLITLIGMSLMLNDLLGSMGARVDWDDFMGVIQTADPKQILYTFSLLMYGLFVVMGTPLIVLLLSMIGLSISED